jgi:riboflavin biosynthesis pyrimidine reductase
VRLLLPDARPLAPDDLLDLYDPGEQPRVRAGFVVSTDGAIAYDGTSRTLQSPADEAVFHALRAVADAVLVGAGTARTEGYGPVRPREAGRAWRRRTGRDPQVPLVLVSRSLDLDPEARCFAGPTVVVTCGAAPAARRARFPDVVVAGDETVDLPLALEQLAERGLTRLLCEGGPQLLTALLDADLVDELCLTSAPLLVGSGPALLTRGQRPPRRLHLRSLVDGGDGVLLARYDLAAPHDGGRADPDTPPAQPGR